MRRLLDHIAASVARLHARGVFARFVGALRHVDAAQQRALDRALRVVADSNFARQHSLDGVHTCEDLRRALPLLTYEDYRPYVDRLCSGDTQALLAPGQRLLMFATSSGTTALPKRIPVTALFVDDYRRGWNTFGLKMLTDHPRAILRHILQSTGRYDAERTPGGVPVGAITGLLARTQKRIVRRYYVGRPEIAQLDDAQARYYTLMRLGIDRDVAFAITANPSTLIQMARTANDYAETLIRDVADGDLSATIVDDPSLRRLLSSALRPNAARAAELAELRRKHGTLRPCDFWHLEFLACWTGGSMGHYLPRIAQWWGTPPIRDVGLLASEGRVTVPLLDNTPVGVLDVTSGVFEFIPLEAAEQQQPATLAPREVETGRDYAIVLSNTTGLLRYRLDDVVRVQGWLGQAPLLEFLHRAGAVSSVAGEKLTEHQLVAAVRLACERLHLGSLDFVAAPCWDEPPYYRLSCAGLVPPTLGAEIDRALREQNEEYASRRKTSRLGAVAVRLVPPELITAMDRTAMARRRGTAEQYKRQCLFKSPNEDDVALGIATVQPMPAQG